jgi:hypothetical protein
MKARSLAAAFLLCLFALTTGFAQNPNMGIWKLNEVKSTVPAGAGKSTTVEYTASGSDIKITTDGVNGQGQPAHSEWTGKFDKKPYPVVGDPDVTYRAYKTKGDTLLFANMKGEKTVSNGRIQVAKDGNSRTVEMTYFDEKKKKTHAKLVYEKQ